MSMPQKLTLYYAPDNASLCVRLALHELGIAYDTVLVDRAQRGQDAPEYLALNPNGLIPVLVTPAGPIYETAAILLWLADQDPGGLMPAPEAATRGHALTWLFWLANTVHPALQMLFYPQKYAAPPYEALTAQTQTRLLGYLAQLEAHADWLDDTRPSAHACYLAPMLRWVQLYGPNPGWCDLQGFPRLLAFAQRMDDTPAAIAAARAEGLGPTPFSAPQLPNPPEGSAT